MGGPCFSATARWQAGPSSDVLTASEASGGVEQQSGKVPSEDVEVWGSGFPLRHQ